LLCRGCNNKPDALARVAEIISIEWTETPEKTAWAGSDENASTY
jgi:hypothetical protein